MFSFAYYSLRTREDAEDVLQDVFIRLWQHWRRIDHDKMGAWLMRTTRNAVVDHVRKRKSSRQHITDELIEAEAPDVALPETDAFRERLEIAIRDLPDPFRSIIIMRDVQGMSYLEIGHILELSQSQVKVYLHRGRRRLRENTALRQLAVDHELIDELDLKPAERVTKVTP